jgi:curli biogenesis system outer membrane secretion channel CsgG
MFPFPSRAAVLGGILAVAASFAAADALHASPTMNGGQDLPTATQAQERPSLVVAPFDFSAISTNLTPETRSAMEAFANALGQGQNGNGQERSEDNFAAGVADRMVEHLLETGRFRILERKAMGAMEGERAMSAEQARLAGARYMLTGSITKMGIQAKKGGLCRGSLCVGGSGSTAHITLTARIVDTATGEIVLATSADASANKSGGMSVAMKGISVGGGQGAESAAILAEAMDIATRNLVEKIDARW